MRSVVSSPVQDLNAENPCVVVGRFQTDRLAAVDQLDVRQSHDPGAYHVLQVRPTGLVGVGEFGVLTRHAQSRWPPRLFLSSAGELMIGAPSATNSSSSPGNSSSKISAPRESSP